MGSLQDVLVAVLATLTAAAIVGLVKLYGDVRAMRSQVDVQGETLKTLPRLTTVLDRLSGTMDEFQRTFHDMASEQKKLVADVAFLAGAQHAKDHSGDSE